MINAVGRKCFRGLISILVTNIINRLSRFLVGKLFERALIIGSVDD